MNEFKKLRKQKSEFTPQNRRQEIIENQWKESGHTREIIKVSKNGLFEMNSKTNSGKSKKKR